MINKFLLVLCVFFISVFTLGTMWLDHRQSEEIEQLTEDVKYLKAQVLMQDRMISDIIGVKWDDR